MSTDTADKDKDPRDVSQNSFNRFDPKYVSIGPKTPKTNLSISTSKCATLKHSGRFGGSLSPNPKIIAQPVPQPAVQEQSQQHIQLQQHHLQKPNNQQLELQTYQLQQQNYQHQAQQSYNISTVSRDYTQQYPSASLPYNKKTGTGFSETSSILKKHREEIIEMAKPSVFSIETSTHRQQHEQHTQTKPVSIINQPLPEIPTQQSTKNPQVLCAANLSTNTSYPASYRSLQRPQPQKANFNTGTTQRNRDSRSGKVMPPSLPPKNRNIRAQQPLPSIQSYQQQQNYRGYDRERSRERDRSLGRSYDDSHQFKSSKQLQQQQMMQQQNFQTLPHHHHYPQTTTTTFSSGTNTGIKNNRKQRGSRELLQQPFENYSATEL